MSLQSYADALNHTGPPAALWTPEQIGAYTAQIAPKYGSDPLVLLAMFDHEAGFDPSAVGDHGTSFGLEQLHIGGALGSHTPAWAQNPANAIKDAAHRLAGAKNGADVARIQRPADPAGYARDIDAKLRILRAAAQPTTGGGSKRPKQAAARRAVAQIAAKHHLTHTSGDRTPAGNPGAEYSAHLTTRPEVWADDYSGSGANMAAFAADVRAQHPELNVLDSGHQPSTGPNVHVDGPSDGYDGGAQMVSYSSSLANVTGKLGQALHGLLPFLPGGPTVQAGEAAAGAAGDVVKAASGITGAISDAVSTTGRYIFTIGIVLLAGYLFVLGASRAVGAAKSEVGAE